MVENETVENLSSPEIENWTILIRNSLFGQWRIKALRVEPWLQAAQWNTRWPARSVAHDQRARRTRRRHKSQHLCRVFSKFLREEFSLTCRASERPGRRVCRGSGVYFERVAVWMVLTGMVRNFRNFFDRTSQLRTFLTGFVRAKGVSTIWNRFGHHLACGWLGFGQILKPIRCQLALFKVECWRPRILRKNRCKEKRWIFVPIMLKLILKVNFSFLTYSMISENNLCSLH